MAETASAKPEQLYKTDELELASFLLSRGCRVEDRRLREDKRVDFFLSGSKVLDLVKEFEMSSPNTLVPVHDLFRSLKQLRDTCTRVKRGSVPGR